jgi:hypothetical protein
MDTFPEADSAAPKTSIENPIRIDVA